MSQVEGYYYEDGSPVRLSISQYKTKASSAKSSGGCSRTLRRTMKEEERSPKKLPDDHVFIQYGTEFFKGENLLRTDTPDTLMTEYTNKPDITVRCDKCGIFIDIRSLQDHRTFHQALLLLKYKNVTALPDNADALLKRRNAILRRLKNAATADRPVDPKAIKQVNDAYERLKSDVEDTYDMCRQIRHSINTVVNGVALNCSPQCTLAVGLCSSQNEKWKSAMEDTRVFQDCFGDDKDKCYLALFDGHHGRFAAEVAATELHQLLLNEMAKFDPKTKSTCSQNLVDQPDISQYRFERPATQESERVQLHTESMNIIQQIITLCEAKYELLQHDKSKALEADVEVKESAKPKHPLSPKIASAFKKVYHLLDILLSYGKDECSKVRWSGCSALTLVVQATGLEESVPSSVKGESTDSSMDSPVQLGLIHLANAGNAHAVLVRGNRPYRLSREHTPRNPRERRRVIRNGGTLSESTRDCQVNGVLATTRGLGNHGDIGLKTCMQVEPSTTCVAIDQYAQFVVLATNGVWEIFSDQDVSALLLKMLPTHLVPPPSRVSSTLQPLLRDLQQQQQGYSGEGDKSGDKSEDMRFGAHADIDGIDQCVPVPSLAGASELSQPLDSYSVFAKGRDPAQTDHSQGKPVSSENLQTTSTPVEEKKAIAQMTISADLNTEVGSHVGEADDLGEAEDCDLIDEDHLPVPTHTDIPDHVPQTLEERQRDLAKNMAEYLVQAALLAGAKDNISVAVLLLPGCGL